MKKILVSFFLIGFSLASFANHTKGGWMYYRYLGPGTNANTARYAISLKIYTECILNSNQWCPTINISIFSAGNNSLYQTVNVNNSDVYDIQNCTSQACHPCVSDIPRICYKIATYEFTQELPITTLGYILSYQRCCRIANIVNLQPGSSTIGDTWTVNIPGSGGQDPMAYKNSSALFAPNDTAMICKDNYFTFDFSATDPDQDSLSYSFSNAYYSSRGNGTQCIGASDAPPFIFVNYEAPFSGSQPLGTGVTIDPVTGIVSGISPSIAGTYVLTCMVTEYKKGTNIVKSSVLKSLHISVADCSLTQAVLEPEYFSCDSFTRAFSNKATGGNIKTYFWDFGVKGITGDTSDVSNPSFTYPDTGTYVLKLVVNKNLACSDSAFSIVKVYPVFIPGFSSQGQCKNTPIQFFDTSTTTFGIVDSWKWDFGDAASLANSSGLKNPTHTYINESNYNVRLTAGNSMGCFGTITKTIIITDKPALQLSNDTLICNIDTLQLNATAIGTVLWSPNYNIDNLTSRTPLVSPDVPTKYYIALTDPYGCTGTDSVFVDVKNFVTIHAGKDTTICQSDSIQLPLSSDALYYSWTEQPSTGSLNNPSLKNPVATPSVTTRYLVTGSIGKCTATDNITITAIPYPKPMVSADTTICLGNSVQLHASGGSSYSWSPPAHLSNRFIPDPIAIKPAGDIRYIVTVRDTIGCPKPASESTLISVVKIIANAGSRDTTVVIDQPLQLQATGGTIYVWSPAQGLNNVGISNPVALPQNDIEYTVKVSIPAGCFDYASIKVKVYKVTAGFYIPTAFSPNNDGRNDFFRPVALGLKSMEVFRVYNRMGQMLFNDTNLESAGWDGTYKGNSQDPATYIWYAEGTDFRGQKIKKKGFVVLVR